MRRGRTIGRALLGPIAAAALSAAVAACGAGSSSGDAQEPAAGSTASSPAPASAGYGQQPVPDSVAVRLDTLEENQRSALASRPADSLSAAEQAIQAHYRAERGPQQPVPFNHAFHVSDLQIQCEYCHTGSADQQVATMPQMGVCMGCHRTVGTGLPAIAQLRTYWNSDRAVPWDRVYKLPEFVQFSHQAHLRNEIDCQECHGPVEEMDRVYQFASLRMGWCLECHRGEPQPSDTATNYRLVRSVQIPEIPAGRQSIGLYPRRIKESYGETRAPVDCAACHY